MFLLKKLFKLREKQNSKFQDEEKPFLDHLEDLRSMLMKIIITLLVATIVTFVFNKELLEMIKWPILASGIPKEAVNPGVFSPVEGFTTIIKICLYAGIVLTFPFLLYFIGEFVVPGLNQKEKKLLLPSLAIGFSLFLIGVVFSYFIVIPRALDFFYHFSVDRGIEFDLRLSYYVSFVTQLTLVFGLCFELPVVVMIFVKLELLSFKLMSETRSYAIVIMFIVAAIITPTTDILTLCMLAGPMIVLYEICIWMAYFIEKKKLRLEQAEEEERNRKREERALKAAAAPAEIAEKSESADVAETESKEANVTESPSIIVPQAREEVKEFGYDPDNAIALPGEDTSEVDEFTAEVEKTTPVYDAYGDDHWKASDTSGDSHSPTPDHDPYHHDHHDHHYHDDYYSGPIEELKRELREELIDELKGQIKAELRDELLVELRKELGIKLLPDEEKPEGK